MTPPREDNPRRTSSKPISLAPLTPEQALKAAMETPPPDDEEEKDKRPKKAKDRSKR